MKKLLVGLTGGFGTGKSTVLPMFKKLGAKTFDCDRWVKACWQPGSTVYPRLKSLVRSYGLIPGAQAKIPLKQVAGKTFQDRTFRRKLEKIIHPVIFRKIRLAHTREMGILVVEIPLLFETGLNRDVDFVVTIKTSTQKSKARVLKKRGMSVREWKARIGAQWPLARKARNSDAVILNNGNLQNTSRQVKKVWNKIVQISTLRGKGENSKCQ
jgi:dephospho-CoA kinase